MRNLFNFIAFDFGIKNIGVAVGQNLTYTASPLCSIKAKYGIPNWLYIKKILDDWIPKIVVVGLPLDMSGNHQKITLMSKNFGYKLRNYFKIDVEMHDERLITRESYSFLLNKKNRYKKYYSLDAISASLILESWMKNSDI